MMPRLVHRAPHRALLGLALPVLLLAGCATATTVKPGSVSAAGLEKATDIAMGVYFRACVGNPQGQAQVQAWLKSNGFMEVPPTVAGPLLQGQPGSAWLRGGAPAAVDRIAVVARESARQCEVLAPATEPGMAAAHFSRLVEALAKPGLAVEKEADDQTTTPDGKPRRFVAYRVGPPPVENGGFLITMSARPVVENGIALVMIFGPAAPRSGAVPPAPGAIPGAAVAPASP